MAKKRESIFKDRVAADLRKLKPHIWFSKIQQVSIRGTPDFLLCVRGYFFGIELKKDLKSKATALQIYNIEQIKNAGGAAFVTSPETWDEDFKLITKVVTSSQAWTSEES